MRDDPKESYHTRLLTPYIPKLNLTPATAVSVPRIIIVGYLMFPDPYRSATPDLEFQVRKYFAWERKERESRFEKKDEEKNDRSYSGAMEEGKVHAYVMLYKKRLIPVSKGRCDKNDSVIAYFTLIHLSVQHFDPMSRESREG